MALPSPQDIPILGLGSAGPCGVQEHLHPAVTHSEGAWGHPCSAGTRGHLGHLSWAPHMGPAATQTGGRLPVLPEGARVHGSIGQHYLWKGVWKSVGLY